MASRRPSAAEIAADLQEISNAHDLDVAESTLSQKLNRAFTVKLPKMHVPEMPKCTCICLT